MNITNKKRDRFNVGDWVEFPYGARTLVAEVIEARGPLGVNRRHLYRVRLAEGSGEPDQFEMPEDELKLASSPPDWFLEEKGTAFVAALLTKYSDVAVRPYSGRDMAIDTLIEVLKDGKSTMRFFGAQLAAYVDLPTQEKADERVLSHLGRDPFEAALPLCVFVVGVMKPEGVYRWVVEPVIENGHALLRRDTKPRREVEESWLPLNELGVTRLVAQVNAWYDALKGNSSPRPHGRHTNAEP